MLQVRVADKELIKMLEQAGADVRDTLGKAVMAGAHIAQDEVSIRAPVRKGVLKSDIVIVRRRGRTLVTAVVKPGKKGWYGFLVEKGVKQHTIRAKKGKVLSDGKRFFGTVAQHPGFSPRPFLQPAFDAKEEEIKETVRNTIFDAIWR